MSTFNTRKDRYSDGRPYGHKHPPAYWINHNPGRWNRLYTTRKRRAADRRNAWLVIAGCDPDGMVWMPERRPTEYYW